MAELTVLYDEGCGFCTGVAARLQRLDGVDTATIGSATGAVLLRDLPPAARYAEFHVVDRLGRRSSGGAALPSLLGRLRFGAVTARVLAAFPGLTSSAYGLAARHRVVLSRLTGIQC